MTMAHNEDQFRQEKIAAFRQVCKQYGIKVTPQRLEIFLEVVRSNNHPTAEDVFELVRKKLPTISLDTVYRTLSTLAECGLVAKVYIIQDRTRFDPNVAHHHHLVCVQCKAIADFQWPELDEVPLPPCVETWGRADAKHLQVLGVCAKCLGQREGATQEPHSER